MRIHQQAKVPFDSTRAAILGQDSARILSSQFIGTLIAIVSIISIVIIRASG
jgi:hypothetical protein